MVLLPFATVAPTIVVVIGASTALWYLQTYHKVLGGREFADIPSWEPTYREAARKRAFNMEREADPDHPVILNPFRHNIPATVRNASDVNEAE